MNTRTFILLSLVFGLLQGPLLPPVFAEGILVALYTLTNKTHKQSMTKQAAGLFLTGIIFDLLQTQTLGITSVIFIGIAWATTMLKGQIPVNHPIIILAFALAINLIRSKVILTDMTVPALLLSSIFATTLLSVFWVLSKGWVRART